MYSQMTLKESDELKNIHIYLKIASLTSVLGLFMLPLMHFQHSVMLLEYFSKNLKRILELQNEMLMVFPLLVSWT